MALATNQLAYWKLDSNSNDSIGSRNGTDTDITYSSGNGKVNNGAGFNGTTSVIALPDDAWGIASGITIAAWIKTSASGAIQAILSRDASTANPRCWQFRVNVTTGVLQFVRFDSSNTLIEAVSSGAAVNTGAWVHVAVTFDTTNGTKLYINGANDGSSANTTALNNNTGLTPKIGADNTNAGALQNYFSGAIDELGAWTRALTPTEIGYLYNNGVGQTYVLSSPSLSPSASQSPSASASASASRSLSPSASQSPSSSGSASASASTSASQSPSSSQSPSASPSSSTSPSISPSSSGSASASASASSSGSASQSPSASVSPSSSSSSSQSASASASASRSQSPSISPSASLSPSPSASASPSPAEYVNEYSTVGNTYTDEYTTTF